jgi:hypothetical protein
VAKNQCCGGYGKHLTGCAQASTQNKERAPEDARPRGEINVVTGSEPLLPHSVKVQNNWTDGELYPHSSFTFKPSQPVPAQQGTKQREGAKEVESESEEDDEYSSSEDEREVCIQGARTRRNMVRLKNIFQSTGSRFSIQCLLRNGLNARKQE